MGLNRFLNGSDELPRTFQLELQPRWLTSSFQTQEQGYLGAEALVFCCFFVVFCSENILKMFYVSNDRTLDLTHNGLL